MKQQIHALMAALVAATLLAGCASSVPLEDKPAPVESRTGAAAGTGGAGTGSGAQSQVTGVDLTKTQPAQAMAKTIYFDFDSYIIKDEYRAIVEQHAKMLTADRKKKLTIEGHTDERGGREYNLALGQRRAEAVQRALALLGASDVQLEAVSFGKERPAVQGSDEAAWAKNRRAELLQK